MKELACENVIEYLQQNGHLGPAETATAELLTWGVSNVVMRITRPESDDFVVKQSRKQLRTEAEWFSQLNRIWREADVMGVLADVLPPGAVPRVLFEDRENYVFGMEAVDAAHVVWKEPLLNGEIDTHVAATVAEHLATVHRETANDAVLADRFGDQTVFRELRVDPFYRTVAEVHPELKSRIDRLIADMERNAACLVLADFSPKNILVTDAGVSLVDFETGHYGDPAFDLGFFLSHILLKAILHAPKNHEPFLDVAETFWSRYLDGLGDAFIEQELARRTCDHLAACTLSRIDGTSGVDYLDDAKRAHARQCAISGLTRPTADEPINTMRRWCTGNT